MAAERTSRIVPLAAAIAALVVVATLAAWVIAPQWWRYRHLPVIGACADIRSQLQPNHVCRTDPEGRGDLCRVVGLPWFGVVVGVRTFRTSTDFNGVYLGWCVGPWMLASYRFDTGDSGPLVGHNVLSR